MRIRNSYKKLYAEVVPEKGFGVFSFEKIGAGDLIECSPVIIIPENQIYKTILNEYFFVWNDKDAALALGFGSLFNHSSKPNAIFTTDNYRGCVFFSAKVDILPNTEITINYTQSGETKLWFEEK